MKNTALIIFLLVLISCSQKTSTPSSSEEKQDRIKVHKKEDLKDQIHQKNEPFEFEKPRQTKEVPEPSVPADTVPFQ